MSEQRKHKRKQIEARVWIGDVQKEGRFYLDLKDISVGGMFLASDFLFEPGEVLTIEFDPEDGGEPIKVVAEVKWTSKGVNDEVHKAEHPGMGLEFLSLSEEYRKRIEALVNTK